MFFKKHETMEQRFKDYLFGKGYLVNDVGENKKECAQTLFSLANLFGIKVIKGRELAVKEMIHDAERCLGTSVPLPFYKGFPGSVRKLTPNQLLLDQLIHYSVTYGMGDFSQPGHSLLEEWFERTAFKEKTDRKEFAAVTAEEGYNLLWSFAADLLHSSRPLNETQAELAVEFARRYPERVTVCNCKDTVFQIIRGTGRIEPTRFLQLPDVVKMAENFQLMNEASASPGSRSGKDSEKSFYLNLKNQDRKLICEVLDYLLAQPNPNIRDCYEKRRKWVGLLHHIHYVPRTEIARQFTEDLRGKGPNRSVYAGFEKEMEAGNVLKAAELLSSQKGSGALARNLNYLLSRCRNEEEVRCILDKLGNPNLILLLQLLQQYRYYHTDRRSFRFVNAGRMKIHTECDEEMARRRSILTEETRSLAESVIRDKLEKALKAKSIGKVYIESGMEKTAIPIQEGASSSGMGVLPKGSRISVPSGYKVRCFTYWEKVDDIDLAAFGLTESGAQVEFSWRTMHSSQSDAIVYSGDETSGYDGGSEYFDIVIPLFLKEYPDVRYIVFTDNVYSWGSNFRKALCKAGFMIREKDDSGEIYEPKTVKTAFRVQGDGSFSYLFALDLKTREMIWLNLNISSMDAVAGTRDISVVMDYFKILEELNLSRLFAGMATEITDDPAEADVIVSDRYEEDLKEEQVLIRSCDVEKVLAYLN